MLERSEGRDSIRGRREPAKRPNIRMMQCNIDARGKRVRLINGIVTLVVGIVLLFAWAMPSQTVLAWGVTGAAMSSGVFMIFEAQAGWCALRAMGFRTPL